MMVRMTSELETNIVAVERTKEYADTANEVYIYIAASTEYRVQLVEASKANVGRLEYHRLNCLKS